MGGIAALLIGLGIIAVGIGIYMRMRASRVTDAPFVKTGEAASKGTAAANPKGAISVEGNVSCPQPLMSPVSNKMCLYYEVKVTAEWKEGDTHKSKELSKEKRSAQFALDDGTGPVWIDAREGGDFSPEEVTDQTKSTSLMGGITGQDLMFGNFKVSTGMLSLGTKYNVREAILPAVPRLYACGKVGSSNEITAPGWRRLLLTNKTREDYLGHAMASAKYAFMAAGGLVLVGGILGAVAAFTGDDTSSKKTAAASTATATATAAAATDTTSTTATAAPADTGAKPAAASKPAGAAPATPAKAPAKTPAKKK
jgi:hypothetical protein